MKNPDSCATAARTCDHRSVGVIITDDAGRYLVFERNTYPPGTAACAGHLDGLDPEAAARVEVHEEVGLGVDALLLVASGWRANMCRRPTAAGRGVGHDWIVYRAVVHGELAPSPRETRNARWIPRAELQTLYERTLAFIVTGTVSRSEFESAPGLDPVWARWFAIAGALDATAQQLDHIDAWSWPPP